jgi:hypothetical protein
LTKPSELQRSNVQANPDYAPGYMRRGSLYAATGAIDQAIHSYAQPFAIFPGSWMYMAAQLERVREMEQSGELAPIPRGGAGSQ